MINDNEGNHQASHNINAVNITVKTLQEQHRRKMKQNKSSDCKRTVEHKRSIKNVAAAQWCFQQHRRERAKNTIAPSVVLRSV